MITRLLLRLVPLPADRAVALLGLPGLPAALDVLARVRTRLPLLAPPSWSTPAALRLVLAHTWLPDSLPRPFPTYLALEVAGPKGRLDELAGVLEDTGLADDPEIDVVAADDPAGIGRLWAYRDRINESVAANGVPHKLDVSVPAARTPEFVTRCSRPGRPVRSRCGCSCSDIWAAATCI